ncbi:calcium-binding protein [Chitinimonas sp. PSY-7]|uniref:calcium-binding protein n=1 Tax=Chitinimonas sp. PSY-7 TaxID=3459088 RepID=UPI0040402426
MTLEDLRKKLGFATDSFSFFLEKINGVLSSSSQRWGAGAKVITLSDYLGDDAQAFQDTAQVLGLSFTESDLKESKRLGRTIISRDTLANWASQVEYSKNSLALLSNLLKDATTAQLKSVKTELNDLVKTTEYLPLPVVAGPARSYLVFTTFSRIYTDLAKIQYQRSYEKLTSGLGNILSTDSTRVKAWRDKGLDISPLQRIDRLQIKLSEELGGINLNKNDSTFAKNWQKWKEETLKTITPDAINDSAKKISDEMAKDPNNKITPERARQIAVVLANYNLEAVEIPKLKGNLLNDSQYQRMASRYAARSNAQQFGRFLGAGGALLFAVPDEAFQAANKDETAKHAITAAYYAANALKAPFAIAYALIEAHQKKESPTKAFNDLFMAFQKSVTNIPNQLPDNVDKLFRRGESLSLGTVDVLAEERVKAIKAVGEEAKFSFNRGKELNSKLGKNSVFFVADMLALANDIYAAANTPTTDVKKAQLTLTTLADTGFFATDIINALTSGTKALRAAQGAAVVGAGFITVSSILNIVEVANTYKGDFSSTQSKWDLSNAIIGTAAGIAGIGVSLVCPPAALLFLLVPNFSAIGHAIELNNVYHDLSTKGLNHEAQVVDTMHKIAALDATPIVNWFSAIYTSKLKHDMDALMTDEWLHNSFDDRMRYLTNQSVSSLTDSADKFGVQSYHLITFSKQEFKYGSEKTVAEWADLAVNVDRTVNIIDAKGNPAKVVDPNATPTLTTAVRSSNIKSDTGSDGRAKGVLRLDNLFDQTTRKSGFDTVYQVDNGDQPETYDGRAVTLSIDNSRSTMNGLYINTKVFYFDVTAGAGDDMFLLENMPQKLDGGGGSNLVSFQLSTRGHNIYMSHAENIQAWKGSAFADTVEGTGGDDMYASNGGNDVINLRGGDDTASVGSGVTVDMGDGDDRTFFDDAPALANGGAGNDVAVFQNMKGAVYYETNATNTAEGIIRTIASSKTIVSGVLKQYESFIGSEHDDHLTVLRSDSLRSFSLGNGNDLIRVGAISDLTVFMGDGNDSLYSNTDARDYTYGNGSFFGGRGDDQFGLMLNHSDLMIDSGEDDDTIVIRGAAGSTGNKAEIIGGSGNDKVWLMADAETTLRFGTQDGSDDIFDDMQRSQRMVLVFDGANQSEVQISYRPYQGTATPPGTTSQSNSYTWTVDIKVGNTTAKLHTFAAIPADIMVVTPKDSGVKSLDMLSGQALSSLLSTGNTPMSDASASRQASLLLDSMASFGPTEKGASASSRLYQAPSSHPSLAAAAI